MGDAQLALGLIRVYCFTCPHFVESTDPVGAHDAMEAHYAAKHAALIRRLANG